MAKIQSVEPNIADLANGWMKTYGLNYKLEQESLNSEIDQALNDYYSKNGGAGGNRPDAKLLLRGNDIVDYPILIEYKGYEGKLVKTNVDGKVTNKNSKNLPDFKAINSYAVNGAVHYANALLHYTSYTDIIAVGMTGYKDESNKLQYEIGVYYVSKSNFGVGQKVDDYIDFSFLNPQNFDEFIDKVKKLKLTQEEIEKIKDQREQEINTSLVKLNNDIYQNEKGLSERDRVYLVAASIIATLGVPGKVAALEKQELKSSTEESYKKRFDANKVKVIENGGYPYIVRQSTENGKKGNIDEPIEYLNAGNTISFGQDTATMFYQEKPYFTGDKIKILKPKCTHFGKKNAQFFLASMRNAFCTFS
ncbi:restriction endonuclease subunit S [Eshraghiella crossota]|jgi:type IIS restriction enzyme M protein|uniref:Type I restriction modification DNA specificity domain-containing protein n=1 Tax=Eshraghiella crossota DSM 2876 TaxID=511680 RepID=D4S0W3_9FIRM|nr:restriction endonuclease subunit S [Butyrivibrio crossotus]EFF68461.1 hypothetical protein BUTYVIB_01733 [Butyrivibrio crossotus DSM 2876]UWO51648.1 restriction endonuclease subunit S [Butyrivibrio crossotus]